MTALEAELLAKEWATTPAPSADVLDVDFADGTTVDHAQNLTATRLGDPRIGVDEALGTNVVTVDGSDDAVSYVFGDQWSKLGTGFSLECTFHFNRPLPVSTENAVCSDKESGGFAVPVVTGSGITFMAYIKEASTRASPCRPTAPGGTTPSPPGTAASVRFYVDGKLAGSPIAATGALGLPTGVAEPPSWWARTPTPPPTASSWSAATITNARIFSRATRWAAVRRPSWTSPRSARPATHRSSCAATTRHPGARRPSRWSSRWTSPVRAAPRAGPTCSTARPSSPASASARAWRPARTRS